jgi:lysozyme family protein
LTAIFLPAFEKLMKWEGEVFTNDPVDPGGATKFGITRASWDNFDSEKDLESILKSDAEILYEMEYWRPLRLGLCGHQCLADTLLSFAVNQGKKTAVRRLQGILGLPTDGILGPASFIALDHANCVKINEAYLDKTIEFYNKLINRRPELVKFEKGWKARVADYRVEK